MTDDNLFFPFLVSSASHSSSAAAACEPDESRTQLSRAVSLPLIFYWYGSNRRGCLRTREDRLGGTADSMSTGREPEDDDDGFKEDDDEESRTTDDGGDLQTCP